MEEKVSKSDRTRRYIIERTAPVFNSQGFAGTSLNDLTEATGLTKGSIYGNFENKEDVALAAFDFNFGRVTDFLRERILARENAIDRLLVYPAVYRQFLNIPFLQPGCPILNTATEADDTNPKLREKAANALLFWKTSLENQVKRGISRNEIKADIDPSQTAVFIMCLIEGAVMQAKVLGRPTELYQAMDLLENYITQLKQ